MNPTTSRSGRGDPPIPTSRSGLGRLVVALCALIALAMLEPQLVAGFDGVGAFRWVVDSLAAAAGDWGAQ